MGESWTARSCGDTYTKSGAKLATSHHCVPRGLVVYGPTLAVLTPDSATGNDVFHDHFVRERRRPTPHVLPIVRMML